MVLSVPGTDIINDAPGRARAGRPLRLALLALTGEERSGDSSASYSVVAMLVCEGTLVAAGTALILSQRLRGARNQRGVLLGLAAGFLFTVSHVAVKAVTGLADGGFT